MPQVDATAADRLRVARTGLLDHLPRRVDAGDMLRQIRQALNDDTGTETDLQHAFVRSDLKKLEDPGAALFICARHNDATKPPHGTLREAKRAQQNVS